MTYISPPEYEAYGLESTTPSALVTAASTIIDAHCRRDSLAPAQYQERIRVRPDRNTVRLTYLPLITVQPATSPLVTLRARYAPPRRGEWPLCDWQSAVADVGLSVAYFFGLSSSWVDLRAGDVDLCCATGELTLPSNALGLGFSEVELAYTAGVDPIPDSIKAACAQIVRNAQATPALNVRLGKIDRMQLEYFSGRLVDETAQSLLAPYVAQKVG
jgi:hypothetical protein